MPNEPLIDPLLISNFVHQVINPLNGVVGSLDNVLDGTVRADRRNQRLESVRAQLEHAIELIRNLAFLSQISISGGKLLLVERAADVVIPQIVIEAAQLFQEMAVRRKIKIELTDPRTQYAVKGHSALLRQVFMNLFDNAVKYSDAGTTVFVNPRGQAQSGQLLVEVQSTGIPIEYEEREKIFERGFRSSAAHDIKASGTGLGLYISKRILEDAHDASIEVEHAKAARRTIFRIRFPNYTVLEPRRERR